MKTPIPPPELLAWQTWFSQIFSHEPKSSMKECAESSSRFAYAAEHLTEDLQLSASQRMEIYCRSHWHKLLSVLAALLPFTVRLLAKENFTATLAVPYLKKHPFYELTFDRIADSLPQWIKEEYQELNRALIEQAVLIDLAYENALPLSPPVPHHFPEDALYYLQPAIKMFKTSGNLFLSRETLLQKTVVHWKTHPLPSVDDEPHYFVLFRDPEDKIHVHELSSGHFSLLRAFQKGLSLRDAPTIFSEKCNPSFSDLLSIEETLDEWKKQHFLLKRDEAK